MRLTNGFSSAANPSGMSWCSCPCTARAPHSRTNVKRGMVRFNVGEGGAIINLQYGRFVVADLC